MQSCVHRLDSSDLNFFDGEIDELSIYNRALSADEIHSLFEAGTTGKCLTSPPTASAGPGQLLAANNIGQAWSV